LHGLYSSLEPVCPLRTIEHKDHRGGCYPEYAEVRGDGRARVRATHPGEVTRSQSERGWRVARLPHQDREV